ncbi:hypothetical protein FA592_06005 [Sulfurospirillum diekertiae]|uniref:Uncharacterized protein n=1 Tax=Sulfurospirillum diekertiae TaxID=1854492 RepID=A0A6G9VS69_9BACT|nr:CFI-box-CTERM domain-containing protein [Sulfurospirillum diekertiae]QIR75808.1 hypothetical protein FA584_06105 [Sulfurospirillum diekertiae]QIR78453.1 hypothetical protein FA592_06005 [Sulfurospirillum diekertiae]
MHLFLKRFFSFLIAFIPTFMLADINDEISAAHLLIYQGKYAQAETTYTQLMTPASEEFIAGTALVDMLHFYRGTARLIQHKNQSAQEDIEAALHPQSSMMYDDTGYMLRARLRLMQGDTKGAFEDYDALLKTTQKGIANGYRLSMALAQRGWAYILLGEQEAAKKDFLAAIATETTMIGMELNSLQKPFWQAVVQEIIPLVGTHNDVLIIKTLDDILKKQQLTTYPFTDDRSVHDERNFSNVILMYEVYGPAFLLREKIQKEKAQTYQANVNTLFASAQQSLLKGDKLGAFNSFVNAFQHSAPEDQTSRTTAVQGMSGIIRSGFTPPAPTESSRKLAIKAQVVAQEKAYQEAIELYAQAINETPWVANFYYDHALLIAEAVQKSDDYNAAIAEMKRFILLSTNALEIREAQDRIYQWEVKRDRSAQKQNAAPQGPHLSSSATGSSSDCFIATAAYGSFLDPHVVTLRHFRDRYLLTNAPGQWVVENYYHYSPPIADSIRKNSALRLLTQMVLTPIVFCIEYPIFLSILISSFGLLFWFKKRSSRFIIR